MFKILLLLFSFVLSNVSAQDDILNKIDNFRLPFLNAKINATFKSNVGKSNEALQKYTIYINNKNESFVLFNSNSSKGQRVLMSDKGLWFYSPNSSRAIRITPLQRAIGQASYGDIAKLRYSGSYDVIDSIEDAKIPTEYRQYFTNNAVKINMLKLKGISSDVSYPHINLWIRADNNQPLVAEFIYASGKATKLAIYGDVDKQKDGRMYISKLKYVDLLGGMNYTESFVEDVEVLDAIPSSYFNVNLFTTISVK
jgi:hypothetical protein